MNLLPFKANAKQLLAAQHWNDKVTKEILYGGAKYGGKSFLGATLIFADALTYPGTHYFIARSELIDLRKYTIPTIDEVFKVWGIKKDSYCKYNGQDNYYQFNNGSRVYLLACSYIPSDPLYERFGSMQMTRGWIEEGGEVPALAKENLKAAIGRKLNKEFNLTPKLLITCNPKKNWMYREFYKPWSLGQLEPDKAFIQAFAEDNIAGDRDYITGTLAQIKDLTMRERLYLGNWEYSSDPANLIQYEKIVELFNNKHLPAGEGYITCDVARFGRDNTVIMVWSGLRCIKIITVEKEKVTEVAERIKALQAEYGIPASRVIVDEDGVGGGVVDILGCQGFVNNSSPFGDDNFDNLKSQCYFKLADLINLNSMHVECSDESIKEKITEELEVVRQKSVDNDKKKGVMAKDRIKEILGRSPDYSDCMMLRIFAEINVDSYDWSY